jgi:hypothetical protein
MSAPELVDLDSTATGVNLPQNLTGMLPFLGIKQCFNGVPR